MARQKTNRKFRHFGAILLFICAIGAIRPAGAQEVFLNYDEMSLFEAPLAAEIGDVTLLVRGMAEGGWTYRREIDDTDESFGARFQAGAQTQLQNRWRVRLRYSGRYATDPQENPDAGFASRVDEDYEDDVTFSVGGTWGTVAAGNITELVRDQTWRARGAGAASLSFDDVFGSLAEWGGGYLVRLGPWVVSAVVDEEGDFDLGAVYQRPIGQMDYRLSTRYTQGVFTSADGSRRFDTKAMSGVGELIYGSTLFDLGLGYETLSSPGLEVEQWYVSSGVRIKIGVVSVSLEGHYGRVEGEEKSSAALGVQYDIARGLSANLGLNYEDATVSLGGVNLIASKGTRAIVSVRYGF
ncbi:MAG: hypothetical protein OXG62_00715 [Nitrospinae bacterium]|nr:hypothetical protein [Nitrospinota bacterium]